MKTLLDLGKELVELGERFNRMAHGDFSDLNKDWFESNWNDFYPTKEALENSQKGSVVL